MKKFRIAIAALAVAMLTPSLAHAQAKSPAAREALARDFLAALMPVDYERRMCDEIVGMLTAPIHKQAAEMRGVSPQMKSVTVEAMLGEFGTICRETIEAKRNAAISMFLASAPLADVDQFETFYRSSAGHKFIDTLRAAAEAMYFPLESTDKEAAGQRAMEAALAEISESERTELHDQLQNEALLRVLATMDNAQKANDRLLPNMELSDADRARLKAAGVRVAYARATGVRK